MNHLIDSVTVQWTGAFESQPLTVYGADMAWGGGALLWLFIFGILTFLFVGKINPFKLAGRTVSFVFGHIADGLRKIRLLPKASQAQELSVAASAPNVLGPLAQAFAAETRVDRLLSNIDGKPLLEHNRGIFFAWIHPIAVPEDNASSAADEAEKSQLLFQYDIPMADMLAGSSHHYFYEDVDGAFIIQLFRGNDRVNEGITEGPDDDFYYIANAMRKTINGNVRRLGTFLTVTLSTFFLLNVFYGDIRNMLIDLFSIPVTAAGAIDVQQYDGILSFLLNSNNFCIITFFISLFLMLMFNFEYNHIQRNNARELDTYVRSYLAYLANRFRSSQAAVMNAIGGERSQNDARTGITKIQWLGWRAFFLEKFLRGVFYQITRNSYNYMVLIPVTFIVSTWFAYTGLQEPARSIISNLTIHDRSFFLFAHLFSVLVGFYFWSLLKCPSVVSKSIAESTWIEYHKLRIEETTHEIVSRFIQEISNWRDRFSGRGGGGMGG